MIKKACFFLFILLILIFSCIASFAAGSGTCGNGVTWTLDDNGLLIISGNGDMTSNPWDPGDVKQVIIEEGVTSICYSAFFNCSNLTTATIGSTVTNIGERAFYYCKQLTSVNIPDSVLDIGSMAFADCINLTSISVPDGVITISSKAFSNCSKMTSITLGNSVTTIADQAFYYCSSLPGITIPDSVTSIGSRTFQFCSSLTNISIPNGVTSINEYTFSNCTNLTNVTIGNGATCIGNYAFSGCSKLSSVIIGNSVTSIGNSAFSTCSSLASINLPDSLTSIGSSAFSSCISLESINIPDGVVSIDNSAFSNCNAIKYANISTSGAKTVSKAHSFREPGKTYDLKYLFDGNTEIGLEIISADKDTIEITISDGITSIGNNAFSGCSSLTSITIPVGVTSIGNYAFKNCSSLTGISIPNSVTSIGNNAFDGCSSLTDISIPDGVTSIPEAAFNNCTSLTSFIVPDSITSIGASAFSGCQNLASITIPSSVTYISNSALSKYAALKSIVIPVCNSYAYQWAMRNQLGFSSLVVVLSHQEEVIDTGVLSTCTDTGLTTGSHCLACGNTIIPQEVIPALGHYWGEATYVWSEDNTSVTATHVCDRDTSHVESETATVSSYITTAATCETMGQTTYKAVFTNATFEMQKKTLTNIQALGHSWDIPTYTWSENNDSVTAMRVCRRNASHVETESVNTAAEVTLLATCTANGQTTYTSTSFENAAFAVQSRTVSNIAATGHTAVIDPAVPATCTEAGLTEGSHCEVCGTTLTAQKVVPATGHNWGEAIYSWHGSGNSITAKRVCITDPTHIETETVSVNKTIFSPTETTEGNFNYTSASFQNPSFSTQSRSGIIPALNTMDVLRLPADLTNIETEALSKLACQAVIVPRSCASIGSRAFAQNSSLLYVRIPNTCAVASDAFEGCSNVIVDNRDYSLPIPTPTPKPTATPTPKPTATPTPKPTATPTPKPTATPIQTPSPVPTITPTPLATPTQKPHYHGDVQALYGMTISQANSFLGEPLMPSSAGGYLGYGVVVSCDNAGKINRILVQPGDACTLFGNRYSSLEPYHQYMLKAGWTKSTRSSPPDRIYINSSYPGREIRVHYDTTITYPIKYIVYQAY